CLPLYKKVQGNLDSVMKRTRENLSGVRVIRAFCLEDSEKEKFDGENSLLYRSQIFVGRLSALLNPLTYVLINAAILLLVFTGAKGGLLQGSVVALYNYMSLILVELIKLANIIITINKSLACARRISEFLEIQPDLHPERPDSADNGGAESADAPAVQFEGVSLSYNGGKEALEDISFSVARGETLGIIGGTGSGKSSVAMMIPRFYDASAGRVLLSGKDVKTFEIDQLRGRVGIVLQTAALFSGTVRDNIRWGNPEATDEEIVEALKAAQAYEFISKLPDGINSKVSQNGKNFSGGQRQRLSIARALVRKPEILILDDSSSALDYATDLELRRALAALAWKPTVIIISQRTVSVMSTDHILVLDDGKQVGFGTHEQLLESCEVYREIYSCAGSHKAGK
ncbi:MAG: ABC transporter ATP-binding protein, partial [Acutalibacteraceae bacterium]